MGKLCAFPFLYFRQQYSDHEILFLFLATMSLLAQKKMKPEMTELWEPVPELVNPGNLSTPPSDAIILFDGTDLSQWINATNGEPAHWIINSDGSMTVKQKGGIETKEEFGSIQLHIEWKTPIVVNGNGQGRGNSGVYFQKSYEIQVLDSYNNVTYSNGQAASSIQTICSFGKRLKTSWRMAIL